MHFLIQFLFVSVFSSLPFRIIIGAPRTDISTIQRNVHRGGAVYRCDIHEDNRCQIIPFDQSKGELIRIILSHTNKSNEIITNKVKILFCPPKKKCNSIKRLTKFHFCVLRILMCVRSNKILFTDLFSFKIYLVAGFVYRESQHFVLLNLGWNFKHAIKHILKEDSADMLTCLDYALGYGGSM